MVGIIDDFPFTSLMSVVGLLIGGIIGLGDKIFENYNFLGLGVNPVGFFTSYFSNFLSYATGAAVFGIVVALVFGLGGFIIDFYRKEDY